MDANPNNSALKSLDAHTVILIVAFLGSIGLYCAGFPHADLMVVSAWSAMLTALRPGST